MRILTTVLAPALVAGVLVSAAPNVATAGSSLCDARRVCIYDDNTWVGLLGQRQPGMRWVAVSSGANDQMTSWENKTGTNARWFEDAVPGGFCRTMSANRENRDVDGDSDKLSSWATNGAC